MSFVDSVINKYGKDKLVEVYHEKGRRGLSEFTEVPYNSIGHVCKALGVYTRDEYLHQKDRIFNKRWSGRNPFDEDTDCKWYLVGFITGDGSIRVHHNRSYLSIASSDYEFIKELASVFDNVLWEERKGCYQFTTGNSAVLKSLREIGLRENKSKYGCDLVIPREWFYSFLRGLLDSDGYVRNAGVSNEITWYGHESYMSQVSEFLGRPLKFVERLAKVSIHSKTDLLRVIPLLYKDCTIKLERKYQRCCQILNHLKS